MKTVIYKANKIQLMFDTSLYLYSIYLKSKISRSLYKEIISCKSKGDLSLLYGRVTKEDINVGLSELDKLANNDASYMSFLCENYPQLLKEVDDFPLFLHYIGNLDLLKKPAIAIVGARDASIAGKNLAEKIANYAAALGFSIVSGLAKGIDKAAHYGAGVENTIAIIGNGLDVHYPRENYALYEEIKAKGLLLSEYKLGTKPLAYFFPRRNRIIAGIVRLVIVIEARERSGSLITCRLALENNREIMAVPGSPCDPRVCGSNRMISEGAYIFTGFDHFKELLSHIYQFDLPAINNKNACEKKLASIDDGAKVTELERKILDLLTGVPLSQDEIFLNLKNYNLDEVIETLTELQFEERVLRDEQGAYQVNNL